MREEALSSSFSRATRASIFSSAQGFQPNVTNRQRTQQMNAPHRQDAESSLQEFSCLGTPNKLTPVLELSSYL